MFGRRVFTGAVVVVAPCPYVVSLDKWKGDARMKYQPGNLDELVVRAVLPLNRAK